jgi:hypothetical protein
MSKTIDKKWKIHPAAAVFPMMADDELDELAADIKQNGQRFPVVRDKSKVILDGRNRLEACRRAGIKPQFVELDNGQDPVGFILSANVARRHLNKGQQAMAVAKIYPEPAKGGRGQKGRIILPFDPMYLSRARTVLKYAGDLAHVVLVGGLALDKAYDEALKRKNEGEGDQGRLKRLQAKAPDLATRVTDDAMDLGEAMAALEQRESDKKKLDASERETAIRITQAAYSSTTGWANKDFSDSVKHWLKTEKDFRSQMITMVRVNRDELENIVRGAKAVANVLAEISK